MPDHRGPVHSVMRLRPLHLLAPAVAAALVVSLRYELWLIVLGITALVVVFARRHVQDRCRWLPALLAVRATASAQPEIGDHAADAATVDLVVLAKGDLDVLDRAADLAHEEPDPDRWSMSIGRIASAHDLLGRRGVPGIVPARGTSAGHLLAWVVAATAALLGVAATSSGWWVIPLVVAYSGAMTAWTDWREEHHWRPALVAAAAQAEAASSDDEEKSSTAAQLAVLARGNVQSVRRALQMVERWHGHQSKQRQALVRLAMAAALLEQSGVARARSRGVAAGWALTGAIAAATWLVTS